MSRRTLRVLVGLAGAYHLALFAILTVHSLPWIGCRFPGFFLISNRVIASIALPEWEERTVAHLFQRQVLAVDGVPVTTAAAVYGTVAALPAGTPFRYTVRDPEGRTQDVVVRSRTFTSRDYVLIFAAYLLNSLVFTGTGLLVAYLKPRAAASKALLAVGLATGLFVGTAVDLYGPHWFVRLHVIGETFMAAAFLHLALVFPRDRLSRHRNVVLAILYGLFAGLAVVYELALDTAAAYTRVHLLASAAHGVAAATMIGVVSWDFVRSPSALVRRRVAVVALGTVAAFAVPAVTMAASAVLGGAVPLNAAAFTAFLFPLSLGYAVIKQDLFEIDVMLRRATTYAIVMLLLTGLYLVALVVIGRLIPLQTLVAGSPFVLAVVNVGLLFLIAPLQARAQLAVDQVFFRKRYDGDAALSRLSHALVSAHTLDDVHARTRAIFAETVCPSHFDLGSVASDGTLLLADPTRTDGAAVALPAEVRARLARGEIVSRYEWDEAGDGEDGHVPAFWTRLRADIVVPTGQGAAVAVLGPKASGRAYSAADTTFLRAAAGQIGLGMANARSFAELEAWNARLERQVAERTLALESANSELQRSIAAVQEAYRQLEGKQASLMRSDRLATLGRMSAGIAHEVNTPLGATINALSMMHRLATEYAESIDDPGVTAPDHHEIAAQLLREVDAATTWARKASAFINRIRVQGRETGNEQPRTFQLRDVVVETEALLVHRLRGAVVQLEYREPGPTALFGVPAQLGQVLINLVGNAIDAYEERGILDGRIVLDARQRPDGAVELAVRDWAGGIPAAILPRVFEEMFTTKEAGRGTGIGLCIARDLVERAFGGLLTVEVDDGVGTCFRIVLPARHADAETMRASA